MNDEELLAKTLARVAAEEEAAMAVDPQLDALAAGTLSAEERRALEARAAQDPALREAMELFAPLPAAAISRAAGSEPQKVRRLIPRWVMPAAAIAAGVMAVVLLRPAPAPLPEYSLEISPAYTPSRGAEPNLAEETVVHVDSDLELVLRPAQNLAGELDCRFFILAGEKVLSSHAAEKSDIGSCRFSAPVKRLQPEGVDRLEVVAWVGRPDALEHADAAAPERAESAELRVFRRKISIAKDAR
jgi:hypothetical protein